MMTCQHCGEITRVAYSKTHRASSLEGIMFDIVSRRRKCPRCGTTFHTTERGDGDTVKPTPTFRSRTCSTAAQRSPKTRTAMTTKHGFPCKPNFGT